MGDKSPNTQKIIQHVNTPIKTSHIINNINSNKTNTIVKLKTNHKTNKNTFLDSCYNESDSSFFNNKNNRPLLIKLSKSSNKNTINNHNLTKITLVFQNNSHSYFLPSDIITPEMTPINLMARFQWFKLKQTSVVCQTGLDHSSTKVKHYSEKHSKQINQDSMMSLCPNMMNKQKHPLTITTSNTNTIYNNNKSQSIFNCNDVDNSNKTCIICGYSYSNENKEITLEKCGHSFCEHCLRLYYEDKIENGFVHLTCPLMKCNVHLNKYDFLKDIISYKFIQRIHRMEKMFLNSTTTTANPEDEYRQLIGKRKMILVCPNCMEDNCLFGKRNKYFYKCLYCLNKVCKFCTKTMSNGHYDMNNADKCAYFAQVIIKIKLKQKEETKKKKMFCKIKNICFFGVSTIVVIILIYLYIYIMIMKNIYYGLFNRKKHNKKDIHQNNSLKKELSLLTQGMTSKNINNNQSDFTGMSMVFDRNRNNNNIIVQHSVIAVSAPLKFKVEWKCQKYCWKTCWMLLFIVIAVIIGGIFLISVPFFPEIFVIVDFIYNYYN